MGVCFFLQCRKCEEWIDCHKVYDLWSLCSRNSPIPAYSDEQIDMGYWEARAFWFTWHHREHGGELYWSSDCDDQPLVGKEVFDHELELKRGRELKKESK